MRYAYAFTAALLLGGSTIALVNGTPVTAQTAQNEDHVMRALAPAAVCHLLCGALAGRKDQQQGEEQVAQNGRQRKLGDRRSLAFLIARVAHGSQMAAEKEARPGAAQYRRRAAQPTNGTDRRDS